MARPLRWSDRQVEMAPAHQGAGTVLHAVRVPPLWLAEKFSIPADDPVFTVGSFSLCGTTDTMVALVGRDDERRRFDRAGDVTCVGCRAVLRHLPAPPKPTEPPKPTPAAAVAEPGDDGDGLVQLDLFGGEW